MIEDVKCQANAWTLVGAGGIDAGEPVRSIDDRISEGQLSSGKTSAFLHPSQYTQLQARVPRALTRFVSRFWKNEGVTIVARR